MRETPRILLLALSLVLGLLVAATSWAQSLQATVDRTTIGPSDVVTLTVTVTGVRQAMVSVPENDDFSVVSRSTRSQFSMVNGQMSSTSSTLLTLMPRRSGELTIGRVPVQTDRGMLYTDPVTVTVGDTGTMPPLPSTQALPVPTQPVRPAPPTPPPVDPGQIPRAPGAFTGQLHTGEVSADALGSPFMVAQVSDPAPYVGEQVIVDYLYFEPAMELGTDVTDLTEPEFTGTWFRDVTEERNTRSRSTQSVRGELYDVRLIRSYIMVPLEAGETAVPEIGLTVRRVGFFRNQEQLALTSLPITIDVQELPEEGRPDAFDPGNVGEFSFSVLVDNPNPRVGDTVRVDIRAQGATLPTGVRLPLLRRVDGMRLFEPDEDITFDLGGSGWIEGRAAADIAMVPEREGELTIPGLSFAYFNPWTETYEVRQSDPVTIHVEGVNPAVAQQEAAAAEDTSWTEGLPPTPALPTSFSARHVFRPTPVYLALTAVAPLAFFGWVLGDRVRRRREHSAPERAKRDAVDHAVRALKDADEVPTAVARELRTFVATKTGAPTKGLRIAAFRELAASLGGSAWGASVASLVERAEMARYAGASSVDGDALRDEAIRLLETHGGRG